MSNISTIASGLRQAHQPCRAGGAGVVAGVDLGGTKILVGLADLEGRILAKAEEPTEHGSEAPVLRQIPRMILSLLQQHREPGPLLKAVVGVPSAVSPSTGLASLSPHLAIPSDRPLAAFLAQALPCPVVVENDVNLAAYAEATLGKGRNRDSLAFVAFGTGVGMGLVVGGMLFRGQHGRAGELGLLPLGANPHQTAPYARAGLFEDQVDSPAVRSLYGDGTLPVAEIFARATDGDAQAAAVIETLAKSASVGIASVQALFDPALIVLGGGIGSRREFVNAVTRHVSVLLPFATQIEATGIGPEAGMLGALMLGLNDLASIENLGQREAVQ
ncbi:ROK family protein [Rhizobium sp. BK538]|uniref:ROK family protein n=1 Tax=Rhizobium sp. BK538 TaxID=2586984 RepID=UPI00178FE4CE|nr:ROK family protein [Rhizobium sp. BK538]MBB4167653.1 glucokinase [Rhizobium sp. BK538]